jgi:tetratricopeptide (TPR) repeat protein
MMTTLKQQFIRSFAATVMILASCNFFSVTADGLQGEFVTTEYWRDLHTRYSPITNPAFITEENYLSLRISQARVLQNFNLTEMGATLPIGLYQSWAFSYLGQTAGKVSATENDVVGDSIRDIGLSLSDSKHFFVLSYANNIWNKFSIGANLALSFETNFSGNGSNNKIINTASDLGISYRLFLHPILGEHLLGLSLQNIFSPFNFGNLSYSSNVKINWLGFYWNRLIESGLEIHSRNLFGKHPRIDAVHVEHKYAARLGVKILGFLKIYAQSGTGYFGFAGGEYVPQFNNGRDMSFLYQYIKRPEVPDNGLHSLYARLQFGLHREESYARRMAHLAAMGLNDLYNSACKLYYAGNYWDAFFVYSQIIAQYPNFFRNDYVEYYRAACFESLDMRDAAEEAYNTTLKKYPGSSIVPAVNLGLMRLAYRDDKNQIVQKKFTALSDPDISDSLKYHSYYLMGEMHFKNKNYTQAAQVLSKIPETHDQYIFAQHTLAIAQILSSDMENAITSFSNCLTVTAVTKAEKELIYRSYVLLGYIFYEQGELSKAVSSLREVPKSSYYYEDALLGLCWSALKARQWNDCITSGKELQKISDKMTLQCDGALLEGYSYFMQKNYKQASSVLLAASEKIKEWKAPSIDTLEEKRTTYENNRTGYTEIASGMNAFAAESQMSKLTAKIDSLHGQQQYVKKSIDDFLSFENHFNRQSFFARNIETIRSDIDYALAISQKVSVQAPASNEQIKIDNKQKELDEKIEKLKNEMEKLNTAE